MNSEFGKFCNNPFAYRTTEEKKMARKLRAILKTDGISEETKKKAYKILEKYDRELKQDRAAWSPRSNYGKWRLKK